MSGEADTTDVVQAVSAVIAAGAAVGVWSLTLSALDTWKLQAKANLNQAMLTEALAVLERSRIAHYSLIAYFNADHAFVFKALFEDQSQSSELERWTKEHKSHIDDLLASHEPVARAMHEYIWNRSIVLPRSVELARSRLLLWTNLIVQDLKAIRDALFVFPILVDESQSKSANQIIARYSNNAKNDEYRREVLEACKEIEKALQDLRI
jgi:DNA-binding ferritin-like protein (Dps family)